MSAQIINIQDYLKPSQTFWVEYFVDYHDLHGSFVQLQSDTRAKAEQEADQMAKDFGFYNWVVFPMTSDLDNPKYFM